MRKLLLLTLVFTFISASETRAQFYDWGQEPASVKWRSYKNGGVKYIYPDYFSGQATKLIGYMDTVRPYVSHGFRHGPMKRMPLILHTQNLNSNGLVMLAPRRMEFITAPNITGPAFPWLKQLAVHEYRHAVQYNNLNRGFIRGISYILGEQGSLVGLGFLPYWLMEGDAVLAETQMSTYGRGMQPSFSIEYRAMAAERPKRYTIDKYFSGSFRDHMPDHYQLGFQIASWADTHYGENIWDKVARYGSSYPFLIFTTKISLKKYYRTSTNKLFRNTFNDLEQYWAQADTVNNTSTIIPTGITSYTTYDSPIVIDDGSVIAIKSDLDKTTRLVRVDPATGQEDLLCHTGILHTGLALDNGTVYWTELRQSMFWEQRVTSVLCSYNIGTGQKKVHRQDRNALFPTWDGNPEYVIYHKEGYYSIKTSAFIKDLPDSLSVHGFSFDNVTGRYYFIGLSDSGMWIGSLDRAGNGFRIDKQPSYVSISGLKARDGKLFFHSIATGKDEAHMLDLGSGKETLLTLSRYGSFSPSPDNGDGYVVTTYTPRGYLLAHQDPNSSPQRTISYMKVPENDATPPRRKWDVINMDEVVIRDTLPVKDKKYSKALHAVNIHSWAPVYFDPEEVVDETRFDLNAGITVFSQNNLNSIVTKAGYYWDGNYSHIKGGINYNGLAPKFSLDIHWSNMDQYIYPWLLDAASELYARMPQARNYLNVKASAWLPLLLSSGYHIRRLTPFIDFEHINTRLYYPDKGKYGQGYQKTTFTLQFIDNVRMSHRDFLPKWGYAASISLTTNPFNDNFGHLWGAYGRVYTPGILPHHSLMLRGAAQYQKEKTWYFNRKLLYPRGADFDVRPKKYAAASIDYQFPFWYPDGGIPSILYFRRIRANLIFDYAEFTVVGGSKRQNVYSYGGELIFDIVPFRLPSNTNASFTFSVYVPSDNNGVHIGGGLSFPL